MNLNQFRFINLNNRRAAGHPAGFEKKQSLNTAAKTGKGRSTVARGCERPGANMRLPGRSQCFIWGGMAALLYAGAAVLYRDVHHPDVRTALAHADAALADRDLKAKLATVDVRSALADPIIEVALAEPAVNAVAAGQPKKRQIRDFATASKLIAEQASQLKDDAAARDVRLQELEDSLQKDQQDIEVKGRIIDEFVLLMRGAAERLAPAAEFRTAFSSLETEIRSYANQAETNPDPEVRKTAEYFRQRAADITAIVRAAEETRSHLSIDIDRFLPIKDRLRLSRLPAELQQNMKGGQVYLNYMRTLAARSQRVADNLDNFWGASHKSMELSD